MAVAHVVSKDEELGLIAFASNGTKNVDAFVVYNISGVDKEVAISVKGSKAAAWDVYRTGASEKYAPLGVKQSADGSLAYTSRRPGQ
jgi:hypothetical protein